MEQAGEVLDGNWIGASTKPAPRLYPHQWSWDSAFIAIGNAHRRPDRAMLELRTLFRAQWTNGMVPHIVFDDEATGYFPASSDWDSRSCPGAPTHVATSGICQPPVHAIAVERVAAMAGEAGTAFLGDMYPPLVAWHERSGTREVSERCRVELRQIRSRKKHRRRSPRRRPRSSTTSPAPAPTSTPRDISSARLPTSWTPRATRTPTRASS